MKTQQLFVSLKFLKYKIILEMGMKININIVHFLSNFDGVGEGF